MTLHSTPAPSAGLTQKGFEDLHPHHLRKRPSTRRKIVSAADAVALIQNGDTLATGGFVGIGFAEELAIALSERFENSGLPRDLNLVYAAGQGDGKERGLNHLAKEGLLKRVIGGHWGLVPKLHPLVINNKIEAYNLPQGCISHLFRDIAAGKPGTITRVGLETFVDPRNDGGRLNDISREDLVDLIQIEGEDYLLYKAFPINVAFIRGTTADEAGNICVEKEALFLESLALATATHNCGGTVIVQVERIAENHSLDPRQVKIPGIFVDCVVLSRPENHCQTFAENYNPAFSSRIRTPIHHLPPMPLNIRKVIARRAALELRTNAVVNLGIGMPEGIARVANEEHVLDKLTLTAEPGLIGGLPATGLNFGAGVNIDALIDQPSQFDFYDGGGLDIAFLGMAEVDKFGNVNVSKFGTRLAGAGGFINISQNAKKVVFVGSFTSGKQNIRVTASGLKIKEDLGNSKFVDTVEHLTFSGKRAARNQQAVFYVTERCVFKLCSDGLELIEIADGVSLESDILARIDFTPKVSPQLRAMDAKIFREGTLQLEKLLLEVPLEYRISYDPRENLLFINFEGLHVDAVEEIEKIKSVLEDALSHLNKRVNVIVNYDNFSLQPQLFSLYAETIKHLADRYYNKVTRYTTSTFLKLKLGEAFSARKVAPHIFESEHEALEYLNSEKNDEP